MFATEIVAIVKNSCHSGMVARPQLISFHLLCATTISLIQDAVSSKPYGLASGRDTRYGESVMWYAYHKFQLPYAIYLVGDADKTYSYVDQYIGLFLYCEYKKSSMYWSNPHEESTVANFRLKYNQVDAVTK